MIALQNVSKFYKQVHAVNNVSFVVNEGETMVLLGTSGCGKTTTLRMVNRLVEQSTGTITVNGANIHQQPPQQLRRSIGYVLQHTGLFPHYTIAENIAIVPRLLQWKEQAVADRVHELLQKLQLDANVVANKYPHQLSGGQQQRAGLARALAGNPPVLLMDEPFGALDPLTRAAVRREFKNLDELKKKTILMVTHDVQEAFELGDTICLMDQGKIVQQGKPAELLLRPANSFVESFFRDQRFFVGLQSLSLADLGRFFNTSSQPGAIQLNSDTSLYAAMEALATLPNRAFYTVIDQQKKHIDFAGVFSAFANFKTPPHE